MPIGDTEALAVLRSCARTRNELNLAHGIDAWRGSLAATRLKKRAERKGLTVVVCDGKAVINFTSPMGNQKKG